jgi:phosphoribosylformylglycinamidine synthase I
MSAVTEHAAEGRLVIGICNGFQVLCESHLLPGALLPNASRSFLCQDVWLRAEAHRSAFTRSIPQARTLRIPIAHGEGRYTADEETLDRLEGEGLVAFRYCDPDARAAAEDDARWNPNGSQRAIAGVLNDRRNVLGLMPHPERACEALVGSEDGRLVFESVLATLGRAA